MLYHAGAILAALGDRDGARRFFRESLEANPHSSVASNVRESLPEVGAGEGL